MKKILIALSMLALTGSTAMAQTENAKTKPEIIKEFKESMASKLKTSGIDEEKAGKFADCLGQDLDNSLNLEELLVFETLMKAQESGEMPSEEVMTKAASMQEKLASLGANCQSILGM